MQVALDHKTGTVTITGVPVPEGAKDFVSKEMLASAGIALRDAHTSIQLDSAALQKMVDDKQAEVDNIDAARPTITEK